MNGLLGTRQVDPVTSLLRRERTVFHLGTVPTSLVFTHGFLSLPDHLRRLLPNHSVPIIRRVASPRSVIFSRPTTDQASLAIRFVIGCLLQCPRTLPVLLSRAPFSVPCRRKHLGAWVNENASSHSSDSTLPPLADRSSRVSPSITAGTSPHAFGFHLT